MPHCFVVGCTNSTRNRGGLSYHSFPKDEKQRKKWLELIGRSENTAVIYERVCSDHFSENSFCIVGNKRCLNADTFPVENLPARLVDMSKGQSEDADDSDDIIEPRQKKMKFLIGVSHQEVPEPATISEETSSVNPISCSSGVLNIKRGLKSKAIKKHASILSSSSGSSLVSTSSSVKRRFVRVFHNYCKPPEHYHKTFASQKIKLTVLKRKLDASKRTSVRRKKKVSSLRQMVAEIKSKFKMSTDAIRVLKSSFSDIPLELMRRILLNNKATSRGKSSKKSYPLELKRFAMTLQFYSCKAYEYVRRTFNLALPATSTIRSWLAKIDCKPGFTQPALDALKIRASDFKQKNNGAQLCAALSLDEMSLKMEIVWERQSGNLWGYVDVGSDFQLNNDQDLANHAFVFMVVGVNDSFKIPIGYFFIKSLAGEERANLVNEALKQLDVVDMKILALICDGPHVHFKMMKELGCSITDVNNLVTYFSHPTTSEKLFVLFDVCHMLKLIRNNWASARVFIDRNGDEIKWEFIEALHRVQQQEGLYFANKLRDKHIQWKKCVMKVNVAAQTLSNSVADTLEFLSKDCELEEFKDVQPTVDFIRRINSLFDILNSRNPFGKGMKTPLRMENEFYWRPFLLETSEYLKCLTDIRGNFLHLGTRKVPIVGFLVAIESFLQIYDIEVKTNGSLKYILTYKFSQDHLELFFCSVRSRNGPNNNPNCYQFFHTYRRLLTHIDIKNNTGNCLPQDTTTMLNSDGNTKQISDVHWERKKEEQIASIDEKIEIFLPKDLTDLQENVRSVTKTISCGSCNDALTQDYDEYDQYLKLIKRRTHGGLLFPSRSVRIICGKTEKLIKLIHNILGYLPKKDILIEYLLRKSGEYLENGNIFPSLHDHILDQAPYENMHRQMLISAIIKKYSLVRLNSLAHRINENIAGEKIRKTLSKLILFKHQ